MIGAAVACEAAIAATHPMMVTMNIVDRRAMIHGKNCLLAREQCA